MPIAGSGSEGRRDAHMRWAERYAKRRNIPKAIAHFGRALEFGNDDPTYYDITIQIPIDRHVLESTSTEFLTLIKSDRTTETKGRIDELTGNLARGHLARWNGGPKAPNLRVEFYDAGEAGEDGEGNNGGRAYAEISISGGRADGRAVAVDNGLMNVFEHGINKTSKVAAGDALTSVYIEQIMPKPYLFYVNLVWGRQTADAEKVIWKHNIRGKIERVLRANGVHALVKFQELQSPKGPVIVDVNATTNYDVTAEHRSKEGPALNPVIGRSVLLVLGKVFIIPTETHVTFTWGPEWGT